MVGWRCFVKRVLGVQSTILCHQFVSSRSGLYLSGIRCETCLSDCSAMWFQTPLALTHTPCVRFSFLSKLSPMLPLFFLTCYAASCRTKVSACEHCCLFCNSRGKKIKQKSKNKIAWLACGMNQVLFFFTDFSLFFLSPSLLCPPFASDVHQVHEG